MNALTALWNRVRGLFRRGEIDRVLEEEMQFHLDMKIRANVEAGMPEEKARRAAHREVGNRTLLQEDSRGVWSFGVLETFVRDLRYGARTLLRNPVFSITVVLTLALGIGANTAIFTLVDRVALRPLPVISPDELFVLGSDSNMGSLVSDGVLDRHPSFFSYPLYAEFREHSTAFTDLAAISSYPVRAYLSGAATSRGERVDWAESRLVSGNFFEVLGVGAMRGRTLGTDDDRVPGDHPVTVMSHAFWMRRFGGSQDIVGRRLHVNGTEYTVLGVTPPGFRGVTVGRSTDMWFPLAMQAQLMRAPSDLGNRDSMWLRIVGRLRPGLAVAQATAGTNDLYRQLVTAEAGTEISPETTEGIARLSTELFPFDKGIPSLRRRLEQPLRWLVTVVGLVLLLACANVGNLLLARASSRQREMGLRLALGASRARLVRQLLTESLLLAVAGGALGLIVARWTTGFLLSLFSWRALALDVRPDHRVLAFTAGVSLLTALLFGLAPALRATRIGLNSSLRSQGASAVSFGRWDLRRTLVVAQVAISLVLLVGAGLFQRSLANLRGQEMGFLGEGLLQVEIDPQGGGYEVEQLPGLYLELVNRIEALPEVETASLAMSSLLGRMRWVNDVTVDGFEAGSPSDLAVEQTFVTPHYFETIGVPLRAGRPIEERDQEGAPRVAVVNEAFARHFFAGRSAVGERFGSEGDGSGRDIEIVGVLADFKIRDLHEDPPRLVHIPVAQQMGYLSSIQVRSRRDPAAVAPQIRRVLGEIAPGLPILGVRSLSEQIDRSLRQEKMLSQVTGFFGVLALLLASIGLYGVLAYGVTRRTGEIGIRMALGAQRKLVLWMVLRTALAWVGVGIAIGLVAALVTGRLVSSLLFGLAPAEDPIAALRHD